MNNKSSFTKKSGIQQCQKCLKYGHWTYECKNSAAYLYRPSRTTLIKNPELNMDITLEKPLKTFKVRDSDLEAPIISSESDHESDTSNSDSESSESSSSKSSDSSSTQKKSGKKLKKFYEKVQNYNKLSKKRERSRSSSITEKQKK
jgi:hypothetical protein